jgi:hypothetical protein
MGCRCNPRHPYGDVTLPALNKKPYLASSRLLSFRQRSDKMATKKEKKNYLRRYAGAQIRLHCKINANYSLYPVTIHSEI